MCRRIGLVVAAWALAAGCVTAADEGTVAEPLAGWEWFQELTWDAKKTPARVDFVLPPGVFDKARPDLGDLRLIDGRGHPVPYALRVRRARDECMALRAREFNRATAVDRSAEVSLDLGERAPEHNEIDVVTDGRDFRRRLHLEGSNDERTWAVLLDRAWLVRFEVGPQQVDVHHHTYPASRFRYLRVRVLPDRSLDDDRPALTAVGVFHTVGVPGEEVTLPAHPGPREAVPAPGGPGSAWTIEFGGNRVPCERLRFDVAGDEFVRPFEVTAWDETVRHQVLAGGEWRRRRGEEPRPLEVTFSEILARQLRLTVTDYRNPPLAVQGVTYSAPARQVVFAPPAGQPPPLRLYFGNPDAAPPHYDFAATLPEKLDPPPLRAELGEPQNNPDYRPPPRPLTERWPWLVYVVLGAASVVLLAVLAALAREAVARHDRRAVSPGTR
jgi:hypothetical protein